LLDGQSPENIAGRRLKKDYLKFLKIASIVLSKAPMVERLNLHAHLAKRKADAEKTARA